MEQAMKVGYSRLQEFTEELRRLGKATIKVEPSLALLVTVMSPPMSWQNFPLERPWAARGEVATPQGTPTR
jgi:hypothetical protein